MGGGYFQGAVTKLGDAGKDVAFQGGRIFLSGGTSHQHSIVSFTDGRIMQHAHSFQLKHPTGIHFDSGKLYAASADQVLKFSERGEFRTAMKVGKSSGKH